MNAKSAKADSVAESMLHDAGEDKAVETLPCPSYQLIQDICTYAQTGVPELPFPFSTMIGWKGWSYDIRGNIFCPAEI